MSLFAARKLAMKLTPCPLVLACLSACALPAQALGFASLNLVTAGDEVLVVSWKGKNVPLDALGSRLLKAEIASEEYGLALTDQLKRYVDWIEENEFHISLSDDGRVVLAAKSKKAGKRRMKLVEKTLDAFDDLLAPPDRSASDETFRSAAWGQGDHIPDANPILLFEIDKASQYADLVTSIGEQDESLTQWASFQAQQPGFAEGRVCAAAWQTAPMEFEVGKVWRSENELVNRLARLAIHRSYGPQPIWFSIGLAWRIETEVMGGIYCFPYRSEFVGVMEHKGWKPEVRKLFKGRKDSPLAFDEFVTWERNDWDEDKVALAWATVEFLSEYKVAALPLIAESFRERYKETYRRPQPGGGWRFDPKYQLSPDDQTSTLEKAVGGDIRSTLTTYFRSWKRPR